MDDYTGSSRLNKNGGVIFMDDNSTARQMVETCYAKKKTTINPIVDWTDDDVWEFLNDVAKVPHCSLYDEGFTRLGCIGCPLQGRAGMLADFDRWPKYKELYIKAFDRMIANHPGEIKVATGELVDTSKSGGYCDIHRMGCMERLTPTPAAMQPDQSDSQIVHVEREREESPIRRMDRGTDLRPVDVELQDRCRTETAAPSQICSEQSQNKYNLPKQWWLTATAQENFNYWISNC